MTMERLRRIARIAPIIALALFLFVILGFAAASVVMKSDKKPLPAGILCEVDKTGITVLEDIIDQFLDDPENNQFIFRLQAFPVIVKP